MDPEIIMAFSTQKDFFKINFLNAEPEEPLKKRSDAAIKNYESVTDARAWSSNQQDRSRFLVETVQRNSASNVSIKKKISFRN